MLGIQIYYSCVDLVMNKKLGFTIFVFLTLTYVCTLVWIDSNRGSYLSVSKFLSVLPLLLGLCSFSFFLRYLRWHWLIYRCHGEISFAKGFAAYLSGFALTASPGKVGELIRIRYFKFVGVPSSKVFAGFFYERTFDVFVVFLLCIVGLADLQAIYVAAFFFLLVMAIVSLLVCNPKLIPQFLNQLGSFDPLAKLSVGITEGLQAVRFWMTPLDGAVAFSLGFIAWTSVAIAFVVLTRTLGIQVPFLEAFSLYPLAILIGASSLIPGGFGTTEAALVALLSLYGVALEDSILAAVGIRLCSLWFSMLLGFLSIIGLELLESNRFNKVVIKDRDFR